MSPHAELIQDLRAHAHEAPATCAALMRRAATELERPTSPRGGKHCPPPKQPEATCSN